MINIFKAITNTFRIALSSGLLVWFSYPFCKKQFPAAVKYDRDKSTLFVFIITAIVSAISFFIADNIIEEEDDYYDEDDYDDYILEYNIDDDELD